MNKKIIGVGLLSFVSLTMLSAYTNDQKETESDISNRANQMGQHSSEYTANNSRGHAHHNGSVGNYNKVDVSDVVPANIKAAIDPTFSIGEDVIITEGHMTGMMGAQAEIVGAFDSYAYSISYSPTNGGEEVYDHKWVVQEEIADAGAEPMDIGTEVILKANHMSGMEGANATIESVEDTTVYVVDYQPTDGGKLVRDHKWLIDSELSPADTEENNLNFGQMKSYMGEMHPNLNNQELNEMYKGMHGKSGSSLSNNFRGMDNMY